MQGQGQGQGGQNRHDSTTLQKQEEDVGFVIFAHVQGQRGGGGLGGPGGRGWGEWRAGQGPATRAERYRGGAGQGLAGQWSPTSHPLHCAMFLVPVCCLSLSFPVSHKTMISGIHSFVQCTQPANENSCLNTRQGRRIRGLTVRCRYKDRKGRIGQGKLGAGTGQGQGQRGTGQHSAG